MTDLIHSPSPTAQPLEACPSCAAPLAPDQRWCLNCGTRRLGIETPFDRAAAQPAAAERVSVAPPVPVAPVVVADGPPRWVLAAIGVGLSAVLFATGLVVGLAGQDRRTLVNIPAAKAPVVNVDVQGGSAAPVASAPVDDPTAGGLVSDWPAKTDGWTVQLAELPGDADQAAVDGAKSDAEGKGAEDVGALPSDDYASLEPNKVIVYSGEFTEKGAATSALGKLKKDFPKAKVIEVSESGAGSEPVEEVTADELESTQSDDPEEQQEASKKLPEKVGTVGTPPPTDNAAPGGGTEGTQIG